MKYSWGSLVFSGILACSLAARGLAEEGHMPDEDLGQVHFPVSCGGEVQKRFDRAVAMLHSFWYDEAEKAFHALTEDEPGCTMGHWGIAMSRYHPLWAPPGPEDLKQGLDSVERAKAGGPMSPREMAYVEAIEAFYKDYDRRDHRSRALAYERAMEALYQKYPGDPEAAVFYALALISTSPPTDQGYANPKKAVTILQSVSVNNPGHPGVVHYIIHGYDSPQLAVLALPAARSYAGIAPASPHAQHMPSHVFTRLGLWSESIASNLASTAASRDRVSKTDAGAASFEQLHAMDYLVYAYLQMGQDQKAARVLEQLTAIDKVDLQNFAAAYAFAAIPARYAVERDDWAAAALLKSRPDGFPWDRYRYAEAITLFARALGAARAGDLEKALKEVQTLEAIRDALREAHEGYWADQVEVQRRAAAAWLAHTGEKHDEALELMRSAADLEDSIEKHPVTPGAVLPARELLGALLMELNQPAPALEAYEASLRKAPNRYNGLYGAARAALKAQDAAKAREYYSRLVMLGSQADTERQGLREAKTALAEQ